MKLHVSYEIRLIEFSVQTAPKTGFQRSRLTSIGHNYGLLKWSGTASLLCFSYYNAFGKSRENSEFITVYRLNKFY
jgi:hypothetical protein